MMTIKPPIPSLFAALVLTVAAVLTPSAFAADTDTTDTQQPAEQQSPPSLDDLLGLEEQQSADQAQQEAEDQVQQRLTNQELGNAFTQALSGMQRSAELLSQQYDAGITTQRIQQDVLTKLQQLIDDVKQQQSSSSSSSSSSSQQQQQQQQPGRQQQQRQQGEQNQQQSTAEGNQELQGPPLQEGDINTVLEETRTEWGSLPQRVREMLLQGRQERFSSLYEQMTRAYYRRLAEE